MTWCYVVKKGGLEWLVLELRDFSYIDEDPNEPVLTKCH